ncbi:hypothetical protein RND81_08G060800 [Saponaria officinalis]|uniref:Uncharacterized protein n=1 Tax=Saponaria officinalis TaxID=3572 RepID=A0AAW1J356_SAPOF
MATNLLPITAVTIRATAGNTRTSNSNRQRSSPTSAGNAAAGKWWTPLFGWSSDADYIDNNNNAKKSENDTRSENIPTKTAKFSPGCFTEEKAKELRLRTKESFHDVMYHSAIASRLASDFSNRSSQ